MAIFFRNNIPPFNPFLNHQFMFDQKVVEARSYLLQFRANHGSIFADGSQIHPLYNTYTFKETFTKLYTPEYFLLSRHSLSSSTNFPLLRNKKVYYKVYNSHPHNRSLSHFNTFTTHSCYDLHSAAQSNDTKIYQNNTE